MANSPVDAVNKRVTEAVDRKRKRQQRPFPACAFEEALEFATDILKFGSGQAVRRISLFDHLQKSPESGPSRQLITNVGKYGLTEGSYQAEHLKLTEDGARAVDDELPKREQAKARVKLAIQDQEPFNKLYERFKGNKLPARAALVDALREFEVPEELLEEAVDTFTVNVRFVGLLQTLSGAERLISVDHLLDSLPMSSLKREGPAFVDAASKGSSALMTVEQGKFETICFYITPIGDTGSEERKHSDLFLGSIVEPAIEPFPTRL